MTSDSTWPEAHVGDLVQAGALGISDGYRVRNEELGASGIPFVRGGDIGDGWINTTTVDHVRPELIDRVQTKLTRPGDVAFIIKGTVGRAGRLRHDQPPVVLAPQVACWRVLDPDVLDSGFVFQLVRSRVFQAELDAVKTHGSMVADYVSITQQHDFRLPIPPIRDQRAIAHLLGTLDDKIELNRQMNKTLEDMAQAIFKSWFIDFDGHTDFVESELGPIPRGWEARPIRSVVEAVYDGPHATPKESDTGAIFLGIKNLTGTGLDLGDIRRIADDDWPAWTKRVVPRGGDIVFSYEATLGHFALLPRWLRCCLGRRTALVRPRNNGHFLFHSFVAAPFQAFLSAHVNPGSTVDRILLKDFPDYPITWPAADKVAAFEAVASPVWARVHGNQAEVTSLAALRDALLPKLISGELRVPEAERMVVDAT